MDNEKNEYIVLKSLQDLNKIENTERRKIILPENINQKQLHIDDNGMKK